jgi:MFS family permease
VLTPHGLLRDGNALINVGFAVSAAAGAALGGALVAWLGVSEALVVDAASFAAVALVLATARAMPQPPPDRVHFRERLREGLRYARTNRVVRLLLTGQGVALFFFTLVIPIEVVYAKDTLETDDFGFGLLLAAWGGGIVIGSAIYVRVKERPARAVVLGSTAAIGLAYLGMALVDDLGPACALSVLGGIGNGVQWVSVLTLVQEHTPEALQARVVGFLESLLAAVPGIGYVVGGALTAATTAPAAYAQAGAGTLALVLVGIVALLRVPLSPERVGPESV